MKAALSGTSGMVTLDFSLSSKPSSRASSCIWTTALASVSGDLLDAELTTPDPRPYLKRRYSNAFATSAMLQPRARDRLRDLSVGSLSPSATGRPRLQPSWTARLPDIRLLTQRQILARVDRVIAVQMIGL